MKYIIYSLFVFGLFSIPYHIQGQTAEYLVFSSQNAHQKPFAYSGRGTLSVQKNDTILVINHLGNCILLHENGKYNKETLDKLFSQADSIMPAKQAKYLVGSELFKLGKLLKKTGSISCPPRYNLSFPSNERRKISIYGDSIMLEWNFKNEEIIYDSCSLELLDIIESPLLPTWSIRANHIEFSIEDIEEVISSVIQLNINNLDLGKHARISTILVIASGETREIITKWLSEAGENNHLAHALYFEEQELPMDAYFAYKTAIAQSAEDMRVQILFRMFKERNGIGKFGGK